MLGLEKSPRLSAGTLPPCFLEGRNRSIFETQQADLVEQSLVGNAELFGGARFVPLRRLQRLFYLESLDMIQRTRADFLERAPPIEILPEHPFRHFSVERTRSGQLQFARIDNFGIGKNCRALDRILQFADISGPGITPQGRASVGGEFQIRFAKFPPETFEKMFG